MAASVVDIVNQAFDMLGHSPIMSLEERTPSAAKARRMWPSARDAVLRDHVWKCTQKRVQLVKLYAKPAFGFGCQYQLPPDFIRLVQTDPQNARVHVEGNRIMADVSELAIAYVFQAEDTSTYDSLLVECMSLKLAGNMAFGTTSSAQMQEVLVQRYKEKLRDARNVDAFEGDGQTIPTGSWNAARLG